MKDKYPLHVKLLTKELQDKVEAMRNLGVNISQIVRNCLDEYVLPESQKKAS